MAEHGEQRVCEVVEQAFSDGEHFDELAVLRQLTAARQPQLVTVPETLRGYHVEHASARDYDRLLAGGAL